MLSGWGRTSPSAAWVRRPVTAGEVTAALAGGGDRGVLARGLGRSYGDAAQNGGGRVLDMTWLDGVRSVDLEHGRVTVGAGMSLGDLMRLLVPRGWFPPVTPGTRHVTVGGAIAADVHGKNHHVAGTFGQHVESLTLATPDGIHELDRREDAAAFWATAGGMGLTGVITSATLRLEPITTSRMVVERVRCDDLDEVMARMADGGAAPYAAAWVDLLATGRQLGRSVLTLARHAEPDELGPVQRRTPLAFDPAPVATAPPWAPSGLLGRWSVRLLNEAWYRRAPRRRRQRIRGLGDCLHPLDGIDGWNRMYGPRGFVQYQLVVPDGAERTLRDVVGTCSRRRVPSFVTVLKRLGPGSPGPLSFPQAGWTLALDVPAGLDGLAGLLDDLDERVAAAGGRVYLAKDARLRPQALAAMYPRLDEWREVRARLDPDRRLRSDLDRRLGLQG